MERGGLRATAHPAQRGGRAGKEMERAPPRRRGAHWGKGGASEAGVGCVGVSQGWA